MMLGIRRELAAKPSLYRTEQWAANYRLALIEAVN